MEKQYIFGVMGPTGCGKSTLIHNIEKETHCIPIWEEWEKCPYLHSSYKKEINQYENQLWFINNDISRFERILNKGDCFCIDKLFLQNYAYLQMPVFNEQEKKTLKNILDDNIYLLNHVNCIVLFDIPTCEILKRIKHRGRDYEQGITYEWIDQLNKYIYNIAQSYTKYFGIKLLKCDRFGIIRNNEEIIDYREICM